MEALTQPDEAYITEFLAPYHGATFRQYQKTLLEWLYWLLPARLHILEARRVHIEEWERSLLAGGLARSTVAGKLVPVCGFYRWAHQQGHVGVDEGAYVRRPKRPRRSTQRWLDRDQLGRLLAVSLEAGPPADLLVHLFALSGLRLAETLEARVQHLGWQDGHRTLTLPSRKGGVMDRIALPAPTVPIVEKAAGGRSTGYLTGRRLTPAQVYKLLDAMSDSAGLDFHVRPHMLRATFVTLSLDAGVPARDVMASTGHAHTAMIDYYDRQHASIRRNAGDRLAAWLGEDQ